MPLAPLLLTVLCVVMIAVGQLMFKSAAGRWTVDGVSWSTVASFLSPLMIAALVLYAAATVLWVYVLRTVPLSAAYAIFALAFLIVPVLAHYVLGEPLTRNVIIGGVVIVAGILIAVR